MRIFLVGALIAGSLISFEARAQERAADAALGAVSGAVASLSPYAARDLANYFASIPPRPANDGNSVLAARGRTIYMDGIPEANIVSCYACHGPNAEGIRDIPRLGGLAYFYIKARLEQWGEGYHSTPGSPMPMVATHLGPEEVEALASYLSFVR